EQGLTRIIGLLEQMLKTQFAGKVVFSFKLLEKINAANLPQWINSLMNSENDAVRHYAHERMNELKGLSVSDRYVIRMDESKSASTEKNILSRSELHKILENEGD